jgi:hypothetical protein
MLAKKFETLIARGWPGLDPKSAQYADLMAAFYGGALVLFNESLRASSLPVVEGMKVMERLSQEFNDFEAKVKVCASIYTEIEKAGE